MVSYAILSRPGNRERNEDSVLMYERGSSSVFALADGLGGHGKGDVASDSVTRQAIETFKKVGDEENYLEHAFQSAQESLLQQKKDL